MRPPLEMEGGTVFHFVTEGIHAALERARAAAGGQDIRLLGGVATIRQYLQARLVEEMHLAVSPILLGSGEHLLAGLDLPALGYKFTECVPSAKAVHYVIGPDLAPSGARHREQNASDFDQRVSKSMSKRTPDVRLRRRDWSSGPSWGMARHRKAPF